jgi:hypothetical protein
MSLPLRWQGRNACEVVGDSEIRAGLAMSSRLGRTRGSLAVAFGPNGCVGPTLALGLNVQQEDMRAFWAFLPGQAILGALVFSGAMLDFVVRRPSAENAITMLRFIGFVGCSQNVRRIVDAHDDAFDLPQSVAKQNEPACHCGREMLQGLAMLSRIDHSFRRQAKCLGASRPEKQLSR